VRRLRNVSSHLVLGSASRKARDEQKAELLAAAAAL
jgi:hypothetical protein